MKFLLEILVEIRTGKHVCTISFENSLGSLPKYDCERTEHFYPFQRKIVFSPLFACNVDHSPKTMR